MIMLDDVFILELFLKDYEKSNDGQIVLNNDQDDQNTSIKGDLLPFENQLPYFLLEEFYTLASLVDGESQSYPPFVALCCKFFHNCMSNNQLSEVKGDHEREKWLPAEDERTTTMK
ncbi:hypothetical protein QYF36_018247 [Acer negundo]|nr:hypothetical protein QYF36_018247 [Acer negundo]